MNRKLIKNIASYIDHTLLKSVATAEDIKQLCTEAKTYGFASVCIHPYYVGLAKQQLQGAFPKVCTVIGFPLGANTSVSKASEAVNAVSNGAQELDMVMNMSAFKSGQLDHVADEIKMVVRSVPESIMTKVILETCYLSLDEVRLATQIVIDSGAGFVKTSTGFGSGGASIQAVKGMKEVAGTKIGIKASGGVKSYESAVGMIEAGATRIGTSSGVEILKGLSSFDKEY